MFKRAIKEETKVPAEIRYLGDMRDFITRVGRRYGVSESIINAFKLAIDEAGTNIIRHAYRDWEGTITIRMVIQDKQVIVSLIDQGHAFDPNTVRDPDLNRYIEIGKKGGLGIFIIRRVIHAIDYHKTVEGNELRLIMNRDNAPRRRLFIPDLSLTMKTRFSLVASGVLTVLVLAGMFWSYLQQEPKILTEDFETGRALARSLSHSCIDFLAIEETVELAKIAADFRRDHAPFVFEALIVDTLGVIQGAYRTDLILEPFVVPRTREQHADDVFAYNYQTGQPVYDVVKDVETQLSGPMQVPRRIGMVHLMLDASVIRSEIASAKKRILTIFSLVLVGGYLGIFVLVYLTMSPFKELSNWVRALGRDEVHDEMDFDASDEIGEIAQAFNDITEKFRKSQVNLAEQERLQKEMQVAQEIQQTLLPAAFPEIEGYEIASYYEAAKEVGGDYFDFVEVDKDTLGIVVADVSGKGVPGSLVMTMIRTALRTEARGNKNAADVLSRVNDFVMNDMKRGMFVTIFYVILDSHTRTISYASAGHNPMILYRSKTEKSYYLNPRGFPIGINLPDPSLFRSSIVSDTLQLREGDVLLIYTDGVTEAMNPHRDKFSDERFLSVIRQNGHQKVDPLVDKIREAITAFTEGYAQNDDITLVAIREKLKAEDVLFNMRSRLMHMVNKENMSVKSACEAVGVSTTTYYKYKKRFEKMGVKGLKEETARASIEEKHISIEDKAKIFDIIKEHPEFGAKRISEELKTEKYGKTIIDQRRIYDELIRSRLNTKELRLSFLERGATGKKIKPPGTPLLTLDGQIIMDPYAERPAMRPFPPSVSAMIDPAIQQPEELPDVNEKVAQDDQSSDRGDINALPPVSELDDMIEDEQFFNVMNGDDASGQILDDDKLPILEIEKVADEDELGVVQDNNDQDRTAETDTFSVEGRAEGLLEEPQVDDVFDALMTDEFSLESELDPVEDDETHSDIKNIIEEDDDQFQRMGADAEIEDAITAFTGEELVGEEMGGIDESYSMLDDEPAQEEGLLEMMEGLGFDRRTVLSDVSNTKYESSAGSSNEKDPRKIIKSGLVHYRQGEYDKAIQAFKKELQADPNDSEAWQFLGDTFFRLGLLREAREAYEHVRQLDPDNLNALENLGVIFANRGDYKKAVWQWGEVLKHNPARQDIIDRIRKMQRVIRERTTEV